MVVALHLRGTVPYPEAHALMEAWVEARIRGTVPDGFLFLEHTPALTIGRARGAPSSILDPAGWPVYPVERGGDATLHAPGQLVAWPILALPDERRDLTRHLRGLEQGVIDLLASRGLAAARDPRNTGVWLPDARGEARKVCAVGIACRRWVTWHGLALNVDVDLSSYARLRPCGFDPGTVTRLADHLPDCPPAAAWAAPLAEHLAAALAVPLAGAIVTLDLAEAWALARGGPDARGG